MLWSSALKVGPENVPSRIVPVQSRPKFRPHNSRRCTIRLFGPSCAGPKNRVQSRCGMLLRPEPLAAPSRLDTSEPVCRNWAVVSSCVIAPMYGTVFTQHAMHSSEHLDYVTQTLAPDEALVATSESSFASCVAGCSWTTGTSGAHRQEVEAFGHCARAQVRLGCSGQVPPPVRHQCLWVRPTNSRTGDTFHFRSAMQVGGARPPANKLFTTLGAWNSSTRDYHGAYCPLLRCPSMPQCGSLPTGAACRVCSEPACGRGQSCHLSHARTENGTPHERAHATQHAPKREPTTTTSEGGDDCVQRRQSGN